MSSTIESEPQKTWPTQQQQHQSGGCTSVIAAASEANDGHVTKQETKCDNPEVKKKGERQNNHEISATNNNKENHIKLASDEEEEEDDDNTVIPSWPCKSDEQLRRIASKDTDHKVYSLKDYSQVASPTVSESKSKQKASGNGSMSSNAGRLLKSMSQERRIKLRGAGSKRMSECIYSTSTPSTSAALKQPPGANVIIPAPVKQGETFVAGQKPRGSRTVVLAGESRIDRMRKLFVSPLSLSKSTTAASKGAGGQRLSLQGSSVLEKPHHLMHAMYRTSAGGGSRKHSGIGGSRRSPMRNSSGKQAASVKSFKVYGCPLQMANNIYPITCFGHADIYKQQSVPYVLARLCNYIEENSSHLTHEGIFRVSGNARLMEKLRTLFDHLGDAPLESESVDVATSASMLKMYLRELPEPLIPSRMNYHFITLAKKYSPYLTTLSKQLNPMPQASRGSTSSILATGFRVPPNLAHDQEPDATLPTGSNERQKLAFSRDLTKLVRKLPIENYNLLKYLACFLYRVSLKQQYNKMCAEALGIVFGPNVFRIRSESYKGLKEQELSNQIMASIISNYRSIFDSELTDPLGNLLEDQSGNLLPSPVEFVKTTSVPIAVSCAAPDPSCFSASESVGTNELTPLVLAEVPTAGADDCHLMIDTMTAATTAVMSSDNAAILDAVEVATSSRSVMVDEKMVALDGECCHARDCLLSSEDQDEGDDDDCDDEGESYTPSTSNGSYCSSINSDTPDSSYEDDNLAVGARSRKSRRNRRHEAAGEDDPVSQSSSECPSYTSYTPTSSHSDESLLGEGELQDGERGADSDASNSSFDSSPSNIRRRKSVVQNPGQCLVCKRRQSAHIMMDPNCSRLAPKLLEKHEELAEAGDDNNSTCDTAQVAQVEEHREASAAAASSRNPNSRRAQHSGVSKSTTENIPPQQDKARRLGNNKLEFCRRRSSSASSLGRVRRKQQQALRSVNKHRNTLAGQSTTLPNSNSSDSKSRTARRLRTTGASGNATKTSHYRYLSSANRRMLRASNRAGNSRGQVRAGQIARNEKLMHVQGEQPDNSSWPELLVQGDDQRYYLLRAFNSDETLSHSVPPDFHRVIDEQRGVEFIREVGRRRRRSSGLSNLILARENVSFNEMNEKTARVVGFLLTGRGSMDTSAKLKLESDKAQESQSLLSATDKLHLKEPCISPVSSSTGNDRSTANAPEDPIEDQMRASKELALALERLLKQVASQLAGEGYTTKFAESLIARLSRESAAPSYQDDCSACNVDPLASWSLVGEIDSGLTVDDQEKCEQLKPDDLAGFITVLESKITTLKQRYNNSRIIRGHYLRNHLGSESKEGQNLESQTNNAAENPILRSDSTKSESQLNDLLAQTDEQIVRRRRLTSVPVLEQKAGQTGERRDTSPGVSSDWSPAGLCYASCDFGATWNHSSSFEEFDQDLPTSVDKQQQQHCRFGWLCPVEFVFNMEKHLAAKRSASSRPVKVNAMNLDQLASEKLELQKNLLLYERWFGRPCNRLEFTLIGPIYERYRAVKMIKSKLQQQQQQSGKS